MLKYLLNTIELGNTGYLPLPKLSNSQLQILANRLKQKGFATKKSRLLVGKKGVDVLHVDLAGLCWSRVDPSDAVAPAIPAILGAKPQKVSLKVIRGLYLRMERRERSVSVRFSLRMESTPLWRALRSKGECGLTPDERDVVLMVVRSSTGCCTFITDFPTEGSRVRVIGGRQYYESSLDAEEASSTLRAIGEKRERNSYLPKGGVLRFNAVRLPERSEQTAFFRGLGEWCYLRPNLPRKL